MMYSTDDAPAEHAYHATHDALSALTARDMETVGAIIKHLAEEHQQRHDDGVVELCYLVMLNICAEAVRAGGASYIRPDESQVAAPYINSIAAAVDGRWAEAGEHLGLMLKPRGVATTAHALSQMLALTRRCLNDQGAEIRHC